MAKSDQIHTLIDHSVAQVIELKSLEKKLKGHAKLRVKFGIDPTGERLHIGHAVVYWKLRQFQNLGHKVIILIGDYTARIGDASDRTAERQPLTARQIKDNMKTYLDQIGRIIDLKKAEVRYNSEWLDNLSLADFLSLASNFKVAQMLERDNFSARYKAGQPIGLQEFLYPLMQGYDSVALKADVELGGTEQLFNLMAGRTLQRVYDHSPQDVMACELLVGNDGRKMSKSQGNCIYLNDEPAEKYGKVMALHDDLIIHYFKLATEMPLAQITQIETNLAAGENPRTVKASLARHIVARYHGEAAAAEAEVAWNRQFREHQFPEHMPSLVLAKARSFAPIDLVSKHFSLSRTAARRLIEQRGLKVDGEVVELDTPITPAQGSVIQVGRRRFVQVRLK